jgi:hypothetical protein
MRHSLLAVTFLTLHLLGGAAAKDAVWPAKAAWEWTTEERLHARFDPAATKARVDAVIAMRNGRGASGTRRPADSIRGSVHPELLMSHEIFDTFVGAAYRYDDAVAQEFRRDAAGRATALGLPPNFLDALRTESEQFIALQRREHELRDLMNGGGHDMASLLSEINGLEAAQCPLRADAITRLRSKFGTTKVNRFLYEVVAPGVFFDFEEPQDAQVLRSREGGCR